MGMRTRAHTPPTVPASTRARSTSPAEGEAAHVRILSSLHSRLYRFSDSHTEILSL